MDIAQTARELLDEKYPLRGHRTGEVIWSLLDALSAAERRATDAEALLAECEWCIPNAFDVPTSCPVCWGSKNTGGHSPDCRLAAFLARKGATT